MIEYVLSYDIFFFFVNLCPILFLYYFRILMVILKVGNIFFAYFASQVVQGYYTNMINEMV